jgi:hypothetical protein
LWRALFPVPPHVLQSLYNHTTPRIISQLLSQWHAQPGGRPNPREPSAAEAAEVAAEAACNSQGSVEPSNGTAVTSEPTAQDNKQLHGASSKQRQQQGATSILQHAGGAVLLQVPVAECGGCASFGALFGWLLAERGMVAAALYRQAQHQGSPLQYVYTNPDQVRRAMLARLSCGSSTAQTLLAML